MSNEIKRVIKKSPEQDDSLLNYVSPLKEDLTSVLLKLFHKIEERGIIPNSFYEVSITLIPK
jgi:hypothetical protein